MILNIPATGISILKRSMKIRIKTKMRQRLTDENVVTIGRERLAGTKPAEIADHYGYAVATVSTIIGQLKKEGGVKFPSLRKGRDWATLGDTVTKDL